MVFKTAQNNYPDHPMANLMDERFVWTCSALLLPFVSAQGWWFGEQDGVHPGGFGGGGSPVGGTAGSPDMHSEAQDLKFDPVLNLQLHMNCTWHGRLFKHWGDLLLKQIVMNTSGSMKSALENSMWVFDTVCRTFLNVDARPDWTQPWPSISAPWPLNVNPGS